MTRVRPAGAASAGFILLIASLMTVTAMSIDINLPAIPATAADLGTSVTTTQLTVSLFFGGFALGQLAWGPLSDLTGRKPAMLAGLILYIAATVGCVLAQSIETLLVSRSLQGLAAGAGSVLARAVIRDLYQGPEMARVLSLALAAFITAPIVAPSLGAAILAVTGSWRWIFVFLAVYGAVLAAAAALFLRESLPARQPGALHPGRLVAAFAAVFGTPGARAWAAVTVLAFGALTTYLTNASAVLMADYALSPSAFGIAFAVVALFSSAGNLLNSRLLRRGARSLAHTIRMALMAGGVILVLTLLLIALGVGGVTAVVVGLSLYFVTFGLVVANATTLAMAPHAGMAGAASAALGFAQTLLPAVLASLVAVAHNGTALPMVGAMLLLTGLAGAVAWRASGEPAAATGSSTIVRQQR